MDSATVGQLSRLQRRLSESTNFRSLPRSSFFKSQVAMFGVQRRIVLPRSLHGRCASCQGAETPEWMARYLIAYWLSVSSFATRTYLSLNWRVHSLRPPRRLRAW